MHCIKRKIIILSFFLLVIAFFNNAQAVTPPYLDKQKVRLAIMPGESGYGDIVINNPSNETRRMRVYLEDWYYLPIGDGSKEFVPANTTPYSCAPWITFSPAEFTLAPFSQQRISYAVKVPPQAQGGYYAVLFFESQVGEAEIAETKGIGGGLSLAIRVGELFYIEAKGTIKRTGSVKNFRLTKDKTSDSLLVEMDFKNNGNVDITAGGSFHIMDENGLIYARNEFDNVYTFPGNTAKLKSNWKESLPKGKYIIVLTINMGKALEETGLGRGPVITKEAEVEIGNKGEVLKIGELK